MTEKRSDELQAEIAYWQTEQKALDRKWRMAYTLLGVGAFLLVLGLWQYGKSAWAVLWMPGALGLAIGLTGYFETKRHYREYETKIAINKAIMLDRKARQ